MQDCGLGVSRRTVGCLGIILFATACGGGGGGGSSISSPAQPTPVTSSSLTGTWSGAASDSTGPGQLTWQLTQSSSSLSGSVTIADGGGAVAGRGTLSGTVTGSSVHFTISVPAGGFVSPFDGCTAEVTGDASMNGNALTGTYSGSSSCNGAINSGQFTLSRS